jgi:integrase/recombinase XerD
MNLDWPRGKMVLLRRIHEKNTPQRVKRARHGVIAVPQPKASLRESLPSILDKYLQHLAVKGFAESTLRVRRIHMKMFLTWCRKRRITTPSQVTKTILEGYQRFLFDYRKKDGQPLAVASQHSRLAPLKVWSKWMTRRNYISQDPAAELELPRVAYKLPSVLNKDEAELVLKQPALEKPLGVRDRALLEVLYSTGIRRMEILRLKLYDVDKNHGLVSVREGKGKRDRVVPIGERALAWLEKYLVEVRPLIASEADEGYVFLTSTGQPFAPNHLSWLARRYVQAAEPGKNGACHIFRHTMATLMLEGGADVRYIQAMLGHARLDTTQIYTHVSIRMLKQIHAATHPAARLAPQDIDLAKVQTNVGRQLGGTRDQESKA